MRNSLDVESRESGREYIRSMHANVAGLVLRVTDNVYSPLNGD